MYKIIAHAEETHSSDLESLLHLLSNWYVALIVFIVGSYLITSIVYSLTNKNKAKSLAVLLICYLICGLSMYEISPLLSTLSIFCGFLIAAFFTFASLSMGRKN